MKLRKMLLFMSLVALLSACDSSSSTASSIADTNYTDNTLDITGYSVVDTGQVDFYDSSDEISEPGSGDTYYGQDANYTGNEFSYTDNGDGTINDNITGLMWQDTADTDGDGDIDSNDKLSYDEAVEYAENLTLAGYSDWRLPTIKELYSLITFTGIDPSGYDDDDTLVPFIDTDYFEFEYGDTDAGERIIDSQYISKTFYVDNTYDDGGSTIFGVNFADGRIKGYGITLNGSDKTFCVICVRGNEDYGTNDFTDNDDGTISDEATGLMWSQDDSEEELNWEDALAWVVTKNSEEYSGYSDWRLPNIKELQSIVDYTRSPETTDSPAINSVFNATEITNEAGESDYAYYWSGTTHLNYTDASNGSYVAFGRGMGYQDEAWVDVHGAGSQKSDPKDGDPDDYPTGSGPQGDAVRIYNYVRLVRDID